VRALGRLQAIESGMALLGALEDEAWQVRAQAARALGEIRATVAIAALSSRLTDSSWWVRHHAAYALQSLGHEGQAALRRIASSSDDAYARDMANEALAGGFHLELSRRGEPARERSA
jgi:HEAT repeat protein